MWGGYCELYLRFGIRGVHFVSLLAPFLRSEGRESSTLLVAGALNEETEELAVFGARDCLAYAARS